jgi:hypothetical protein
MRKKGAFTIILVLRSCTIIADSCVLRNVVRHEHRPWCFTLAVTGSTGRFAQNLAKVIVGKIWVF